MSSDRDVTRTVRSWLEEGATALPDRVLDTVLDQLPATPQRRATWWPARRSPEMSTTIKIAMAAAAVVVVAFLGIGFLGPGLNIGGPEPTPEPTATPLALPAGGPLDPGTFYVAEGTPADQNWAIPSPTGRFTFTVPASGWARNGAFVSKDHDGPNHVSLSTWIVSHIYADACQWSGTLVDVGTTVNELESALMAQAGRDVSAPTDVTLGGLPAKRIEMSVEAGLDTATCDMEFLRSWPVAGPDETGGLGVGAGSTDVVYIVDVNGSRYVIVARYLAPSSAEDRAELQAIVDSIQIEP